jgi:Holliday junction resolvase RusA-like endonuclease
VNVQFTVPLEPLNVNHAYAPARWGKRHGFRKTDEASTYQEQIAYRAKVAMQRREPFTGTCRVVLTLVYSENRCDIDGALKLILDALQGVVYRNDRQIRRLVVDKVVGRDRTPCIELEITEYAA